MDTENVHTHGHTISMCTADVHVYGTTCTYVPPNIRTPVLLYGHPPKVSALAMLLRKMVMNHSREYWYMGSMLARSVTQKKRI